uniref:Uncharacterized protein n=1 Tax=Kalanchoe fedtschenkoi TaxID=63787 RepID=A0A7N0U693_KALFE
MSLPTFSLFLIPSLVLLLFMPDSSLGQGVAEGGGGVATINCLNCSNCQYPCHPQSPPPPPPPEPEPSNPPPPPPCPATPVQCCQNSPPQMPPYNYIPPPPQIPYNYIPPPPNHYAYLPYNNFSASVPLTGYMHHHPVVLPIAALLQLLL